MQSAMRACTQAGGQGRASTHCLLRSRPTKSLPERREAMRWNVLPKDILAAGMCLPVWLACWGPLAHGTS